LPLPLLFLLVIPVGDLLLLFPLPLFVLPPQNKVGETAKFSAPKSACQMSTLTTQFTTTWPQKHHAEKPFFQKTPEKTSKSTRHHTPIFFGKN